jgi:hypothetical protein
MYRKPTAIVANRPLTVLGVVIAAGATLTQAQLKAVPKLQAFLNDGTLRAVPDPWARKIKPNRSTPTYLPPAVRKAATG